MERGGDDDDKVLRELEFRMGVTTVMLSTLDLDYILYIILSGITSGDGLGFNRAFLFLEDDHGRNLRVRLAVGATTKAEAEQIWSVLEREKVNFSDLLPRYEAFRGNMASQVLTRNMASFKLPLDRLEQVAAAQHTLTIESSAPLSSVLARCLVNRRPFSSNNLRLRQEIGQPARRGGADDAKEVEALVLRHIAMVPLVAGRRLIGAIVADNAHTDRPVDDDHLRSLHALGNLAALAIDRARLHAHTVSMAEKDGLTGVYNRRYYGEALTTALAQIGRVATPLSIVVFDLDHFKSYNDEHGHLVGDEVLKDVARLLVEQVRSSDLVARYGGEEFVLLLRDTTIDAAATVADKLRERVKAAELANGRVRGLTLSAGVATALSAEEGADELFARADAALYRAKEGGRDRVVVAPSEGDS